MRTTPLRSILSWTLLLPALGACGGATGLDAGAPPRPLLFEVEELRFGMTPAEVKALWGPGRDGDAFYYENRPGWTSVSLGFDSYPPGSAEVQPGVPREPDGRGLFLVWVRREAGDPSKPMASHRADLVARFGEAVDDEKLRRVHQCERSSCELFRASECGLLQVEWRHPWNDPEGPEVLLAETHYLAPRSLVAYAPRAEWPKVRGEVPLSFPDSLEKTVDAWPRITNAPGLAEILAGIGKPNLVLEKEPGKKLLLYLALDGSIQVLRLAADHLEGAEGSFQR